ncbi:cGMP-dependent 3',5'-cyclic phosphodiesterase [Caerostris darwini]|uniref:cGMP-dependent 3',5'-cyclic phosphodiesterase n=1 Tax=Caerostris darwini TaxID=1538125 RepID=A0AAV4X4Q2_9ARAC|nr:cGMP-dependent 3',5'-cyclic phosphodiesterase [Caerostris darwini]
MSTTKNQYLSLAIEQNRRDSSLSPQNRLLRRSFASVAARERLEKESGSQSSFILNVSKDEQEIFCTIQSNSFRTAIKENRSLTLEDINQDQVSVIEGSLGSSIESLLCVPVPGVQECSIALIVCLANKEGFGEEDEKLVRDAFRCAFPILLRAAAYEEERRLREECQVTDPSLIMIRETGV